MSAASELFAERGYAGASIDEIGERAGISGPGIYRYFRGKDALLEAVVADATDSFTVARSTPPPDLEQLSTHVVAAALDDPATLITFMRERHRLDGAAKDDLGRAERRLYRPWAEAIGAVDPGIPGRQAALRQRAVLTALGVIASRQQGVGRPALDRLLVRSIVSVLAVPSIEPHQPGARRPTSWSIAPSRRDEILAAALRLFRERGYHDVSIDEIGEAVGITGPTIYFHYRSKSDLLADAHERASVRTVAAVHDAIAEASSADDALDRLAFAHLRVAADNPDLILVTSREVAALDAADAERLARRGRDMIESWVAVVHELRPDLDDAAVRTLVQGVFPIVNQVAYALDRPNQGVPLVRAWVMGRPVDRG